MARKKKCNFLYSTLPYPYASCHTPTRLFTESPHSSLNLSYPQEFEFLTIEQETRPKKAISNKRVWKTSKEWNTAIFISGCQKCKVALQDDISAIFLRKYPASNTSIYTLSTYARHVIINPVLRIKILLFQIHFAILPQNWSSIARSEAFRVRIILHSSVLWFSHINFN